LVLGWGVTVPLPADLTNPQDIMGSLGPLSLLVFWLGSVNIFLGLFNMIPGFPLDGGRVLRSILWALNDNLQLATRWASWTGQFIAWSMIIAGTAMLFGFQIPILGTGLVNGMWLIFIGWFLNSAAIQSYQRVVMQQALEDVPITNLMRSNVQVIAPDISINTFIHEYLMESDDRAFPVVEKDQLIGLVTLEDVRSVDRKEWDTITVGTIMTPREKLETIDPQADASQGFNRLMRRNVSQLPVVRGTELLGILRQRDIVRWLQFQSDISLS
jgi:CBS domain-containing protein